MSYTAPALRIAGFIHLNGLPSMLSRTSLGKRESRGLMSLKSLLDNVKVLRCCNKKIDSGSETSLLLCRSSTDKLGAFSKLDILVIWLKERVKVSNFFDSGTALND